MVLRSEADAIEKETGESSNVRSFLPKDLDAVLQIEDLSFDKPWSQDMFKALYQISPDGFYVITADEKVLGFALLMVESGNQFRGGKGRGHLLNLAVHPESRKIGLGTRLFETIVQDMRRMNLNEISLEVRASNSSAISFYTKLGFERRWVIKDFYGDEDAVFMSMEL